MKSRKWKKISALLFLGIALLFLLMPTYMQEALIHWFPDISDTYIFPSDTVGKADSCWEWPEARDANRYRMTDDEEAYLEKYGTVAYLVIQDDSIRYEEYREDWTPQKLSNIFSATKSIVGLLVGIAYDEGFIESLDDKVSKYLPEFGEGDKITIRNLLTMSSGLDWDEAYTALISKTTQAYYGDRIRDLIMDLKVVEEPGKKYSYKSGDTQLLSFVLEAALDKVHKEKEYEWGIFKTEVKVHSPVSISEYAERKLWKPLGACNDALWNLDREDGDEKTYCCFNTTARDLARLGRLILNKGNWNGRQLISETYLNEAITPAGYLENEFGDGSLDYYGFQIWIMHYKEMRFPAFRGLGGQYMFVIPQKKAIGFVWGINAVTNISGRKRSIWMLISILLLRYWSERKTKKLPLRQLLMGYIFLLPGEHRTGIHHRIDFFLHFCNDVFIVDIRQDPVDHVDDHFHILFFQSPGCDSRSSDTDTGSLERRTAVERHHVFVDRNVGFYQGVFSFFTGQFREFGPQVDQHAMVVCSA